MTGKRFKLDDFDSEVEMWELLNIQAEVIFDLENKNEQLKQFKDNVFDLIDKNIKETKELFEDGKIDLISYNSAMIILIGLKEELKGDGE